MQNHEQIIIRDKPMQNTDKQTYAGLTYEYMENYIMSHGTEEKRRTNLRKYAEMRNVAECQGKRYRYPVIRNWFLDEYPEIVRFGIEEDASTTVPDKVHEESAPQNAIGLPKVG